jgi:hypothetical protein
MAISYRFKKYRRVIRKMTSKEGKARVQKYNEAEPGHEG